MSQHAPRSVPDSAPLTHKAEQAPPAIHIVGLGVSARAELLDDAERALTHADVVIGAPRQLETVAAFISAVQETIELPKLAVLK
ncbi:MAG: hypothetical protein ACPGPF_03770, partial [Pontibacterium sp.]